jgi:hypothetical protein
VGIENVNGVRSVLGRARTMAQLRNAIIKQMMSTATDAELIALGERFEKLLLEYVDAWLAWTPLMRAARAEAEADIATLTAAIQRKGCDVAQARMSELERDMQPRAEEIIAAPATSLGGLRAKALVALWEALPAHAFHHGAFEFRDDGDASRSLFDAVAVMTGLMPLVRELEGRLAADVGFKDVDASGIVAHLLPAYVSTNSSGTLPPFCASFRMTCFAARYSWLPNRWCPRCNATPASGACARTSCCPGRGLSSSRRSTGANRAFSFFRAANLVSTASTSTFDAPEAGCGSLAGPAAAVGVGVEAGDAPKGLKGPTLYKAPTLPAWIWTGLYLGVNAGYGWGKSNTGTVFSDATTGTPLLATITSAALKGATFGGQAGFNWQSGPWVVGIGTVSTPAGRLHIEWNRLAAISRAQEAKILQTQDRPVQCPERR